VAIQEEVWGRDGETVPASVLLVSAKSGGILIGAETTARGLVGFVWSMPGVREGGARTHWSHMLGVVPEFREHGLGEKLKWAQRERAVAQGAERIEWTFDPLQAPNAHFNLHVLGAVGARYGVDIYGALAGPLHRGTPTDRLIVEWRIGEPHVARRVEARERSGPGVFQARSAEVLAAPSAIETLERDGWVHVRATARSLADRRILVPTPPRFIDMQRQATEVALAWRFAVRDVMADALDRGYRAVDFLLNRERGGGSYLLARE
jgi:predicted GNAT superfamily acetyltransferase